MQKIARFKSKAKVLRSELNLHTGLYITELFVVEFYVSKDARKCKALTIAFSRAHYRFPFSFSSLSLSSSFFKTAAQINVSDLKLYNVWRIMILFLLQAIYIYIKEPL